MRGRAQELHEGTEKSPEPAKEGVVQQSAVAGDRRQLEVVPNEDGGGAAGR
jgi:hypothetical protein